MVSGWFGRKGPLLRNKETRRWPIRKKAFSVKNKILKVMLLRRKKLQGKERQPEAQKGV